MRKNRHSGFTIVELLIVIVVIAILATISIVAYNGIQDRTRNAIVEQNLASTAKALEMFNVDNGRYPSNSTEFTQVRTNGLRLTATKSNTLLYCVDSSNPTAWWLLAGRYPSRSSLWSSTGLKDNNNSQVVGSGQTTCQAISENPSSSVIGTWAYQIATCPGYATCNNP